jgi:hypothetical protein
VEGRSEVTPFNVPSSTTTVYALPSVGPSSLKMLEWWSALACAEGGLAAAAARAACLTPSPLWSLACAVGVLAAAAARAASLASSPLRLEVGWAREVRLMMMMMMMVCLVALGPRQDMAVARALAQTSSARVELTWHIAHVASLSSNALTNFCSTDLPS